MADLCWAIHTGEQGGPPIFCGLFWNWDDVEKQFGTFSPWESLSPVVKIQRQGRSRTIAARIEIQGERP